MNDVEVILVGDELLAGRRTDKHLAPIARTAARVGARVAAAYVVGDRIAHIASAVRDRLGRARMLVVCGGLGPTDDDITREGVAEAVGLPLVFHEPSWRVIESFFAARGREAGPGGRRQARLPEGAEVIENRRGTAPGFAVVASGTEVVVLPGPPGELQPMVREGVLPRLERVFGREPLRVETFRTIGVGESQLAERFADVLGNLSAWGVSSLPWVSGVDLVLTARPDARPEALETEIARVDEAMRAGLGGKLYERGERSLAEVVAAALTDRGATLAVAESLTGGMIGTLLTDVPGASAFLLADVVTYGNQSKIDLLGVAGETIARDGAVSEATCREMAEGARVRCGADWSVATTGIAGPTGGSDAKPVGLVFLGVAGAGETTVRRVQYTGHRDAVRRRAAHGALWLLLERVREAV